MLTIEKAIDLFLVDRELKGNTEKTLKNYRQFLGYFVDYIGANKRVDELILGDLKGYHLYLMKKPKYEGHPFKVNSDKGISKVSIQTYLRTLRVFIYYLFEEGYTTENLGHKFKLPKAPKKTVDILSDEEIDKLLNAITENSEFQVRNKCMIVLMLDSGLRRNEVLDLEYDKVHISQNIIKVFGKGQKERLVPIGLYTKKLLLKYIQMYRPISEYPTKKLFLDQNKRPMTENAIKMIFTRLRKKTNIDRLHPHMLRHTFATRYLIHGGDIFSLQQILGHTSLEMVRRYSHVASSYLISNHKRLSPLDNFQKNKYRF
ncbi:tyrosine-type recombinase/integrase [Clostridiaceae bacterium 35-E11]